MYPSETNPSYGVFVKKIEQQLTSIGASFKTKAVITIKHQNSLKKALEYFKFNLKILLKGLFKKYDVVYAHYPSHCTLPLLIIKFIKPSTKIVVNFHGSDVTQVNNYLLIYFTKKLLTKVQLIISPSEYFKEFIIKKYDANKNLIISSPSGGIDCIDLTPKNTKNSVFTIGYLSRIDPKKGWDILIQALNNLKTNKLLNFKCVIGGDGRDREKLIHLINQYNLKEEVTNIGKVNPKDLNDFYNSIDVFVFPTQLNESLGLVGAEAMACGIPIITSNSGGQTSYAIDGENSFIYNANSYEELSEKIVHFYNLPLNKKILLKAKARETALQLNSKTVSENLYKKIESTVWN
jgi:glycosyltransferase involved in cell wall biosynthesis